MVVAHLQIGGSGALGRHAVQAMDPQRQVRAPSLRERSARRPCWSRSPSRRRTPGTGSRTPTRRSPARRRSGRPAASSTQIRTGSRLWLQWKLRRVGPRRPPRGRTAATRRSRCARARRCRRRPARPARRAPRISRRVAALIGGPARCRPRARPVPPPGCGRSPRGLELVGGEPVIVVAQRRRSGPTWACTGYR